MSQRWFCKNSNLSNFSHHWGSPSNPRIPPIFYCTDCHWSTWCPKPLSPLKSFIICWFLGLVNFAKPKSPGCCFTCLPRHTSHIRKLENFLATTILLLSLSTAQSQKTFIYLYQDGKASFELKLLPLSPAYNLIHSGSLGFRNKKKTWKKFKPVLSQCCTKNMTTILERRREHKWFQCLVIENVKRTCVCVRAHAREHALLCCINEVCCIYRFIAPFLWQQLEAHGLESSGLEDL